jgi:hypothetical protein
VPNYRLYRLDGAGKIAAADWIEAVDDDDAARKAREREDGNTWEVWDRDRLVARIGRQPTSD